MKILHLLLKKFYFTSLIDYWLRMLHIFIRIFFLHHTEIHRSLPSCVIHDENINILISERYRSVRLLVFYCKSEKINQLKTGHVYTHQGNIQLLFSSNFYRNAKQVASGFARIKHEFRWEQNGLVMLDL